MQSWDTVEEVEEEMDIFAELGAVQTVASPVQSINATNSLALSDDPLAAFMEDEEEGSDEEQSIQEQEVL